MCPGHKEKAEPEVNEIKSYIAAFFFFSTFVKDKRYECCFLDCSLITIILQHLDEQIGLLSDLSVTLELLNSGMM